MWAIEFKILTSWLKLYTLIYLYVVGENKPYRGSFEYSLDYAIYRISSGTTLAVIDLQILSFSSAK